ncbi:hypothetical protein V3C99_018346 [Haemonchus contortus]|uniref:Beta-galactosidase n=1 Tax=Haemonchus contortus TaxID=6289 RepID=A0A7I5EEB4_HAECO
MCFTTNLRKSITAKSLTGSLHKISTLGWAKHKRRSSGLERSEWRYRNENGNRLAGLLSAVRLFHGNSFFQKEEHRRWTWESPNGTTHAELDHIVTNRKWYLPDFPDSDKISVDLLRAGGYGFHALLATHMTFYL